MCMAHLCFIYTALIWNYSVKVSDLICYLSKAMPIGTGLHWATIFMLN